MKIGYSLLVTALLLTGCGEPTAPKKSDPPPEVVPLVPPVPAPGSNEETEKIMESDEKFFSEGKSKEK